MRHKVVEIGVHLRKLSQN